MTTQRAFAETPEAFEEIYSAVMETPRGRWFVQELVRRNRNVDTLAVLDAIERFKERIAEHREEGRLEVLRAELQEMASAIAQTRSEIAAIKSDNPTSDRITAATGELEAILTATEGATGDILTAAEALQTLADEIRDVAPEAAETLEMHATNIMMACSFQDLTGQRTTKVVGALKYIETRVNTMIQIWGVRLEEAKRATFADLGDERPDAGILSGPAMAGEGVSQDAIDAMLGGDFSVVDQAELAKATQMASTAETAVERSREGRAAAAAPKPVAPVAPVAPIAPASAPEIADAPGAYDQSDIDSLFA